MGPHCRMILAYWAHLNDNFSLLGLICRVPCWLDLVQRSTLQPQLPPFVQSELSQMEVLVHLGNEISKSCIAKLILLKIFTQSF